MNAQRQFVLGIFFVVALSILAFYTLFLTDFSLFGEPIQVTADFPDAHWLREGDPVLVAGTRIGRVKQITFRDGAAAEERIRVVMNLDQPLEILEGYRITIEESTFLGGRNVYIDPGPAGGVPVALAAGEAYRGSVSTNPLAALQDIGKLVADNSDSLTSFLANLDAIAGAIRNGDGLAHRLIFDRQLGEDVQAAGASLRQTTADLQLLVADIKDTVDAVRRGEGSLGKLLTDDSLHENASVALETLSSTASSLQTIVEGVREGRGIAGALFKDDDPLEADLRSLVGDLALLAAGLERGEGLLGTLLKDPELAAKLDGVLTDFGAASADLRRVAERLSAGEGSLGALLTERDLYDELRVAVKLLTRSLEDYREAAPVGAFTSALFGAF